MAFDFLEELDEELDEALLSEASMASDLLQQIHPSSTQTVHDHLQFQTDLEFDLNPESAAEQRKVYTVDSYFFLPINMGITPENFTRDQFYTSITNYMRIATPLSLEKTASLEKGLLEAADRYFQVHLISHLRQPLEALVVQDVKLFGCYINTHLKSLQNSLWKIRRQKGHSQDSGTMLEKYLLRLIHALSDYRVNYMSRVRHKAYLLDQEVRKAFLLVDEYLSYKLEAVLINVLEQTEAQPEFQSLRLLLQSCLESEMEYRQAEGLLTLDKDTDKNKRETYYYRLSLLKKYVSDVLYLQIRNLRKDKAYRNLVAAAGAALAALWAGLVDLQRFYYFARPNVKMHASDFALRFFMVVIVGVFAYVFKDRIKEISREYFFERLKQHLPDYEFEMLYRFYNHSTESSQYLNMGRSRQFMRFIQKSGVPPEVLYVRELGHRTTLDPERVEKILHYSHQIHFDSTQIEPHLHQVGKVKNITRFSIAPFLEKLDEPKKKLRFFSEKKGIATIKAPKVYHLNVLLRYTRQSQNAAGEWQPEEVELERIRLILNKKGIQRIETVIPRGLLRFKDSVL